MAKKAAQDLAPIAGGKPPKPKRPAQDLAPARHTLPAQLREIIDSRGLTHTELGQLAGVDPTVIARFVAGERDLRLETAGRIAASLGLRLVEVAQPRGRGRSTGVAGRR